MTERQKMFLEIAESLYEEAEDAKARIVLCCLLAAMTDKEYEELTK